jgi:5-methylcytosine-specific restriction endonuclease McrA
MYGIVLLKKDSYKWLVKISREGDLLGWPVATKKTKAWNSRRRAKKRNKLPSRYESFLLTPYWRAVRKLVLARDGGVCTKCGSNKNLHIHHITYANHFNELEHLGDLITLCKKCHKRAHGK